jgi:signal transduction histidine kinase
VQRRWALWGLGLLIWTALGLCEAAQCYFRYNAPDGDYAQAGRYFTVGQALAMGLLLWYGWAVVWFFLFRLARTFPLERGNWLPRLLLQVAAGVVAGLAKPILDYPVIKLFYCPQPETLNFPVLYGMFLTSRTFLFVQISWAMLGIAHAWNSYAVYWRRELRASQLETALTRAQLHSLKAQLHPHFLFNTLNSISALIPRDAEAADRMLARLGDLLRMALEDSGAQVATLERELRFVHTYLEIEQVRFGPRLAVRAEVEEGLERVTVPCLLLQPLVENALRHGIAKKAGPGSLAVRVRRAGAALRLQVEDDGPGLPAVFTEGVGLANTKARLRRLYGADHAFRMERGPAGGVLVTVELPYRCDAEAEDAATVDGAPAMTEGVLA